MEYELEEVEKDYIAFRKEMGEYDIENMRNSTFMVMADTVKSLSWKESNLFNQSLDFNEIQ